MRILSAIGTFIIAAVICLGCGGGPRQTAGFKKGSMPPGFTWDGKYFCDFFGEMQLAQTGSTVVGTVEYGDGRIEGTADGNILRFTWTQQSGPEGLGSKRAVTGRGVFQYLIEIASATGREAHNIHGVWGYDQNQTGGGQWECYKSKKDILRVQKLLMVHEEGAVAAAGEVTGPAEEGETQLKGVGAKKKKTVAPTYEVPAPETGDERLEELEDLDF